MSEFNICGKREEILRANNHLLVEGGPGSGKTTIALLKAKTLIENGFLKPNQKILFLSFARATISRIEEQSKNILTSDLKRSLEINTYHGFCWNIIKAYGHLLESGRKLKLITPPNLQARLAGFSDAQAEQIKSDLFNLEGLICFDLFARTTCNILGRSERITHIYSSAYPYIIVDEFQDTDTFEWQLIRDLGKRSTIMALADLEQRIYEFRGASITRIPEYLANFKVLSFDLGKENNRSANTDIVKFGDDLLAGSNVSKVYNQVKIVKYAFYKGDSSKISIKNAVFSSISRLNKAKLNRDWSLAILVKRKVDTLSVSTYLSSNSIAHEVLIDPAGPSLAASLIAFILEPPATKQEYSKDILRMVIVHLTGRKGEKSTKADLELARALKQYLETGLLRGSKRNSIIQDIERIVNKRNSLKLQGIPAEDWLAVRKLFEESTVECIKNIYFDALYVKLLHKGAILNDSLGTMWRERGEYHAAAKAIDEALTQEHFSMTSRVFKGIYVMNIHKSKGKEFDEVIIWEEYKKPLVYPGFIDEGKLLLRVAVTRARSFTTILTPALEPCILL